MELYPSKLEPSGRLLIPAALRQKLGLQAGSEMVIEEEDGVLRVQSKQSAILKAQEYFAQFRDGKSWSEELIAERRAEAERDLR